MHTRSYRHLSAEERETVSLGLARGHSIRAMARILGRAPSTVSRELSRNATRGHPYRACTAQTQAAARACQPRGLRKLAVAWLWRYVQRHLMAGCSPEQIAGRLRRAYPGDMRKQLSAETIYAALYVLPRGAVSADAISPQITEVRSPLNTESQCPFTAHHDGGGTDAAKGGLHGDSNVSPTRALSL